MAVPMRTSWAMPASRLISAPLPSPSPLLGMASLLLSTLEPGRAVLYIHTHGGSASCLEGPSRRGPQIPQARASEHPKQKTQRIPAVLLKRPARVKVGCVRQKALDSIAAKSRRLAVQHVGEVGNALPERHVVRIVRNRFHPRLSTSEPGPARAVFGARLTRPAR